MNEHELSAEAITKGKEMARSAMDKYVAKEGYLREIRLTEDHLAAMLARAFDAGQKAQTRS